MADLVDHRGNPVRTDKIRKLQGGPSLQQSARQPFFDQVALGMTPDKLAGILKEAAAGDSIDFLGYAVELEPRDLQFRTGLTQRKSLITELPVMVVPASDEPNDQAVASECERIVSDADFKQMQYDALDGFGKGFSMQRILWDRSENEWFPGRFEHMDPRHFRLDPLGQRLRIRDDEVEEGIPLEPWQWVEHRPRLISAPLLMSGMAWPVGIFHLFKAMAIKGWLSYVEVFGMPLRLGRYSAEADEQAIDDLEEAVRTLGADASATLPDWMQIEFVDAVRGQGGPDVFEKLIRWADEQISKGVVSQTMTSDSGASRSQAEVHERMLRTVARRDAMLLARTIQRDVIEPFVRLNFAGPFPNGMPRVSILVEDPEDPKAWHDADLAWSKQGLPVVERAVRERLSLPEPEEGDRVIQGNATPGVSLDGDGEGGEGGGEGEPEGAQAGGDGQDDKLAQNNLQRVASRLLTRAESGDQLTEDQWRIVDMHAAPHTDEIDRMVDEELSGDGWRKQMEPVMREAFDAARNSTSYEEFRGWLNDSFLSEADFTHAFERLSVAQYKARGLGNGTDKV